MTSAVGQHKDCPDPGWSSGVELMEDDVRTAREREQKKWSGGGEESGKGSTKLRGLCSCVCVCVCGTTPEDSS